MAIRFRRKRQKSGPRVVPFGPLLIGTVYGLAQFLPWDPGWGFLYLQGPFAFTALSGVAIAFACRPVLTRIAWSRGLAMALGVGMLMGIGPLGDWSASALMNAAGLAAFPLTLPTFGVPLLLGTVLAGLLMGWFYRPSGGEIGRHDLLARIRFHSWSHRLRNLTVLSLGGLALLLALAWSDSRFEESATALYVPMMDPNPWFRLEGVWMRQSAPNGGFGVLLTLLILWLRELAALLPLIPFALVIRGSWLQVTLVFTLLLFVLGEFAPLMINQPYPSLAWLAARTGLGLGRSLLLGGATAALFGVIRSHEGGDHRGDDRDDPELRPIQ